MQVVLVRAETPSHPTKLSFCGGIGAADYWELPYMGYLGFS